MIKKIVIRLMAAIIFASQDKKDIKLAVQTATAIWYNEGR